MDFISIQLKTKQDILITILFIFRDWFQPCINKYVNTINVLYFNFLIIIADKYHIFFNSFLNVLHLSIFHQILILRALNRKYKKGIKKA